jgi:uncharacterized protein (TIGR00730 family)
MKRLCVYCGSSLGNSPAFTAAARELGEAIAARGIELVYGGARVGLMNEVAAAALSKGGKVIGVLPRFMMAKELAHESLTELHLVDTMHQRKQLMAELAHGFVALPGGFGTFEEIFEAMTWAQLHLHQHPCALLNVAGYYDALLAFLDGSVRAGFVRPDLRASLIAAPTIPELFERLAQHRPPQSEKWVSMKVSNV